ncbi:MULTISPECIES: adenylosuccinate lyase [Caproicibacterium]|uniref:Adenylosuccinate lyase n=1 Tax=Caproicibacterium lactatifermentans TaxID=2666138 RepID=A0A859DRM2_9FIRM|nr:adenylosuccinate lyase [Caproicibacterium lactatifermentans]ARP50127.1 adenylosuccinate lyase [Ruminococcaceae bacterium CPB6]MDD4807564.1 adenylosuccinate lyase [Oscillospiraceae bacterium]QKN24149.1 adenylosuccinate lyase [Caproicibacterium lactatifermentans]QKO30782.1 adenylosuccinate lyase [Caproicibacterium lactatifermentans]
MKDTYESPLSARYADKEMKYLFSPDKKFRTWRRLWIALAESEKELGLSITQEQIDEMKAHRDDINYDVAEAREKEVRHDVMSHVYAFGVQCPKAEPIIHLGATSCYVGDNTDIIIMTEALQLVEKKIVSVLRVLAKFAEKEKDQPTLAFTHFQPAQPTTVGKRATLWMQDLLMDLEDVRYQLSKAKLLGSKGTTGTQASFLELFDGDHKKVKAVDCKIAEKMGFSGVFPVSGQTYSRKLDSQVLNVLSGVAQSAAKFSNDIRLLQHLKEVEEPFEKKQIGSSAMAYKRNPMRSERIASLARYVIADALNPAMTASTQWFERTLDDSANKRISVPEAFLAVDGILNLYRNVADGLVVYPKVIMQHLQRELPFMATENIMMDAVKRGGDRQQLHEHIRQHSMAASKVVKEEGGENDLLQRIADDPIFGVTLEQLQEVVKPEKYVGCAPQQTEEFLKETVAPVLAQYAEFPDDAVAITV